MLHEEIRELYESIEGDAARLILEDELTGVFNRRFLLSYLERQFGPVERGEEGAKAPVLGVIMLDVDKFKQVNDTYGHDAGDELIVWVASLLREFAGEGGLPIRWGGDEFVLLLPGADRETTRDTAEKLCRRARAETIELAATGTSLQLTMSIGVASSPEDAAAREDLTLAADAALYSSKRSGRDRVTSADEVDPEAVFPKAALHRLEVSGMVAREAELELVAAALDDVAEGRCRMLLFEGEAGLGKTMLLNKIGASLSEQKTFRVAATAGSAEEDRRSLYLVERIEEALEEAEVADEPTPEAIVLLLDDLHLADAGSLDVLGRVLNGEAHPTLICATTAPAPADEPSDEEVAAGAPPSLPLQAFLEQSAEYANVDHRVLASLAAGDIERYLSGAFPGIGVSQETGALLQEVTGGNPLFMNELIRMLITDEKIRLIGQAWIMEPLRKEDLPASLDEIVSRQIATLDDEDRRLLEQLSVLGENASFQALAGTSQIDEARLLDFMDRVQDLGLLRVEQERQDWNLRFAGKAAQEASYEAVDPARRRTLHQRVATYHEQLSAEAGGPPAAPAHHQRLATEPEQAAAHEEVRRSAPESLVASGAGAPADVPDYVDLRPGAPLEDTALASIPSFLRALIGSVRAVRLYPAGSQAITRVRDEVGRSLDTILETTDRLKLSRSESFLLINDRRVATSAFGAVADSTLELMADAQLDGIAFDRGIGRDELQALLDGLAELSSDSIEPGYWQAFRRENGLHCVDLAQQSYSRAPRSSRGSSSAGPSDRQAAAGAEAPDVRDIQTHMPDVLRSLLAAVKSARLYPAGSDRMGAAIGHLEGALAPCIEGGLSLERFDDTLAVNGLRLDAADFRALEERAAALLRDVDVDRLTFSPALTADDLAGLVNALLAQPDAGGDPEYWRRFTLESGLSGLAVNDHRLQWEEPDYGSADTRVGVHRPVHAGPTGAGSGAGRPRHAPRGSAGGVQPTPAAPQEAAQQEQTYSTEGAGYHGDPVPQFGAGAGVQLVGERDRQLFAESLGQLFSALGGDNSSARKRAAGKCREVFDEGPLAERYRLATGGKAALTAALAQESDVEVLRDMIPAIRKCAEIAIRSSDYGSAGDLYGALSERLQALDQLTPDERGALDELLVAEADPRLGQLLGAEVRSRDPERISGVLDCVRYMGPAAVAPLVDIVEQETDLQVRRLVADALAETGPAAAQELKRALTWAEGSKQRVRILEVIDSVTDELREELPRFLADRSASVRQAAFDLVERLGTPEMIDVVAPLLDNENLGIARNAARALRRLGTSAATDVIVRRLQAGGDTDVIVACCQALGELADARAAEALADLVKARRWGFLGPRWAPDVRAAATSALRHIPGREASEVLQSLAADRDTAVRRIAARGPARAASEPKRAARSQSTRRDEAAAA